MQVVFCRGESFEIKARKEIQFVSGKKIKVRVDKNQPADSLADDQSSVLVLSPNSGCRIQNCANIKILAGSNAGANANAAGAFIQNLSGNGFFKKIAWKSAQ